VIGGSCLRLVRLAVPLLLALTACGGGGSGGGPTSPPPPTKGIVFSATGTGGAGISLAQATSSDPNTLLLEVRATSVTDLYGVAFDLHFPTAVLRYVTSTQGPFLADGSLQTVEGAGGVVIVGLSKLGTVPGATGSGVLLTLQFQGAATGTGAFSFARNTAVSSSGQTLSTLAWSAGSVNVTL
jgi:hypothetical protein